MKQIETDIIIHAPAEKVWQVLTTFENYSGWNPFITTLSGGIKEGKRLKVILTRENGKQMIFNPVVLKFDPGHEFRWKGKLGVPGVFDGEHYFILEKPDAQHTKFIHGEKFSGLLVFLMGGIIDETRHSFERMNIALKKVCESEWQEELPVK